MSIVNFTFGLFVVAFLSGCDSLTITPGMNSKLEPAISTLDQVSVAPGETITLSGKNLSKQMKAKLGDQSLGLHLIDSQTVEISIPADTAFGIAQLSIVQEGKLLFETSLLIGDDSAEVSEIFADAAIICSDIIYKNSLGDLVRGQRDCTPLKSCSSDGQQDCIAVEDYRAGEREDLEAKVIEGQTVAGVMGTVAVADPCTADSSEPCVADGLRFKAVSPASILDSDIRAGATLASVVGTFNGRPADCSADGEVACVATGNLPAVDRVNTLDPRRGEFESAIALGGVTGLIPRCSADGQISCVASSLFPVVNKSVNLAPSQLSQIHNSLTIAGETGTLMDCASDGDSSCFVNGASYRAALIIGAAAKILTGQSVAGVQGNAQARPANCSSDGEAACVAIEFFPAIDKVNKLSASNLGKIQSNLTIAGATGTLSTCTTDGSSTCAVIGPSFAAANVSAAANKILQGQTLAGVTGSAAPRPTNCNTDGGMACTTHSTFPAAEAFQVPSKVLIGQTLAGIGGGINGRPLDCNVDGQAACVTTTGFPAADSSGAAAKILAGEVVAGINGVGEGRPLDCSLDGANSCVATGLFPAVNKALRLNAANLAKIHNSLVVGGESGTLAPCSGDGQTDCFANVSFPAAEVAGAAAKLLSGETLAGQNGIAPLRPGDCSVDGEESCVATGNYPAIDKAVKLTVPNLARIHNSVTIAGEVGTLQSCGADGQSACLTSAAYPAADTTAAAAKIPLGDTLAGITGSANAKPSNCALDGALGCTTSGAYPAADSVGASAKIAIGETLGGIPGTATVRPNDCSSDGATNCVAGINFPVIDKVAQLIPATMAKIRSSHSVGGVQGTLPSCTGDGEDSCVVVGPSLAAMTVTGAQGKILSGQSVGGIAGNAAIRPGNCASDNSNACVTIANYPAVNKTLNLSASNLTKVHNSLSFLGSTGTMGYCAADGVEGCLAVAGFPSADTSGAEAKILVGQTLAGIPGTAAVRPSDCSSSGATGCVAVSAYPAVDKINAIQANVANFRSTLTLLGTAGTLADCTSDGINSCVATNSYTATAIAGIDSKILAGAILAGITGIAAGRNADCSSDGQQSCVAVADYPAAEAAGAAAKITSGQTLAGINGAAAMRPSDCSADAQTACVAVSTFPAIAKDAELTPNQNKIHSSLTIAGVTGTLIDCAGDGLDSCQATNSYPALQVSGAAPKILAGQTLGGVNGSAPVRPADCSADNGTECVAVANYPAVVKSSINTNKAKIRSNLTVAGIVGTMTDCSSDGALSCFTVSAYPAVNESTAEAKILLGQSFGGADGNAPIRPADCSAGNSLGCTAATNFPAIKIADLTPAVLKSGTSINGVSGNYPSSTYPLSANTGTTDLTAANFNTRVTTSSAFEWFDSSGQRNTASGDGDIPGSIKSAVSLFGKTGTFAPNCTADGQTSCFSVAAYPSADTNTFNAFDIRYGSTFAGVDGKFYSPVNNANASGSDVYASLTDKGNASGSISGFAPNIASTVWLRDPNSDSNSNGTCDGSEHCVYKDQLTNRYWAREVDNTILRTWEDAITYCENLTYGGYTNWRLPMEKEIHQAKIDGINILADATKLNHGSYRHWTATTRYSNHAEAMGITLDSGEGNNNAKDSTIRAICTR